MAVTTSRGQGHARGKGSGGKHPLSPAMRGKRRLSRPTKRSAEVIPAKMLRGGGGGYPPLPGSFPRGSPLVLEGGGYSRNHQRMVKHFCQFQCGSKATTATMVKVQGVLPMRMGRIIHPKKNQGIILGGAKRVAHIGIILTRRSKDLKLRGTCPTLDCPWA